MSYGSFSTPAISLKGREATLAMAANLPQHDLQVIFTVESHRLLVLSSLFAFAVPNTVATAWKRLHFVQATILQNHGVKLRFQHTWEDMRRLTTDHTSRAQHVGTEVGEGARAILFNPRQYIRNRCASAAFSFLMGRPTGQKYVCVSVCVCVRERERERM